MPTERTLSILKPDATRRNLTGQINAMFEGAGLAIIASPSASCSASAEAEGFYAVHRRARLLRRSRRLHDERPGRDPGARRRERCRPKNREIMGATNPANADEGTIRKRFAESIEANSVHGSDSAQKTPPPKSLISSRRPKSTRRRRCGRNPGTGTLFAGGARHMPARSSATVEPAICPRIARSRFRPAPDAAPRRRLPPPAPRRVRLARGFP